MGWQQIKNEYLAGEATLKELSEKYGVSFSTIQKKSMEEGWKNLRKKVGRKSEEKIINRLSNQEAKRVVSISSVADKLLDKITELVDNVPMTAQSVKQITSALKDIKEIKGEKSAEDRREQMARIKKLEKEIEAEAKDTTVIVQFEEDITKWNK